MMYIRKVTYFIFILLAFFPFSFVYSQHDVNNIETLKNACLEHTGGYPGPKVSCTTHCSHISDFNICSGCISSSRDNGGMVIAVELGDCLMKNYGTKEQGDDYCRRERDIDDCRDKLRNAKDNEERQRYINCFRYKKHRIEDCVSSVYLTIKCEEETSLKKIECKNKCESMPYLCDECLKEENEKQRNVCLIGTSFEECITKTTPPGSTGHIECRRCFDTFPKTEEKSKALREQCIELTKLKTFNSSNVSIKLFTKLPGLGDEKEIEAGKIAGSITTVISLLFTVSVFIVYSLTILVISIGGIRMLVSGITGNPNKYQEGKNSIKGALLGLFIVLISVLLLRLINNEDLNRFNLGNVNLGERAVEVDENSEGE